MRDMLEATELGRPSSQTDRVLFQGVDVFALSAREVVRRVGEFTSIEEDPDDDASFIAPHLLLSFWRLFAADDEPEEEPGYHFSAVLLARPGTTTPLLRLRSDSSRTPDRPVRTGRRTMTLAGNIRREHFLDAAAQPAVGVDRFEPRHPLEQVAAPVGQEGSELVGYGVVDQAQPGEAGADADLGRSAGIRPQLPGPRRSVVDHPGIRALSTSTRARRQRTS
ncbi:hypothetical protein [Streptomyces sp. NPDC058463]|uniref:hypothetical protein n=1 Tax=Streptomyces sp. NPDC058463 TaxID=3346510 RepID=UPI0036606B05